MSRVCRYHQGSAPIAVEIFLAAAARTSSLGPATFCPTYGWQAATTFRDQGMNIGVSEGANDRGIAQSEVVVGKSTSAGLA